MLISPLALDLAHFDSQERMQLAARVALADEARAVARRRQPSASTSPRLRLAGSLRNLAVRLDPSLDCEPRLAMVTNPR